MTRYKMEIEYDGTGLVGWQTQKDGLSVEQIIEEAIFKFSHQKTEVYGAGRTDAGVHAIAQTAHFDLETKMTENKLCLAINALMSPHSVSVIRVTKVADDFHARFDAKRRFYVYKILNRRAAPALDRDRVWWVSRPLNDEKMRQGSVFLIGKHDFTSFRSSECQAKSPVKTMDRIDIVRKGDMIEGYFEARSFLHHQVRNIMGTLKAVGEGRIAPDDVKRILDARDRRCAGVTAPAHGLYLLGVEY